MMDLENKADVETRPLNRAPCRTQPSSLLFGLVLDDPTHNRGLRMLQELVRACGHVFPSPDTLPISVYLLKAQHRKSFTVFTHLWLYLRHHS